MSQRWKTRRFALLPVALCFLSSAQVVQGQNNTGTDAAAAFLTAYRAARIRSFAQSAEFGRTYIQQAHGADPDRFLTALTQNSDPRVRQAALAAAQAVRVSTPQYAPVLRRALYDGEPRNKMLALDVISEFYPDDAELLEPIIDASVWDQDRAVRGKGSEVFAKILRGLERTKSPGVLPVLNQIVTDLSAQTAGAGDSNEALQIQAMKDEIARLASTISANASRQPPHRATLWEQIIRLPPFMLFLMAGLLFLVTIHIYYLILFAFKPHRLFVYLYNSYPIFVVPYLLGPDFYRKSLRPARGLLGAIGNGEYIKYIEKLSDAARAMNAVAKTGLVDAIANTFELASDERLKASLFAVLGEVDHRVALRMMDLKPEDREISSARKNMSKILDLPEGTFTRPRFQLGHALRQATTISADFYNVLTRASDSYAIYMVDVMGHGLAASLQAMQVSFVLKAAPDWGVGHPSRELERADELIRDVGGRLFAIMNFLEVDLARDEVRYATAGMPAALLFKRNQPEPKRLMAAGAYIGDGYSLLRPDPMEATEPIGGGDLLVLCSDGILLARARDGNSTFGESRLIAAVKNHRDESVDDIVRSIVRSCEEFSGRARPRDDQSVIVIRIGYSELASSATTPKSPVGADSLSVSANDELGVRAAIRKESDWPMAANNLVHSYALEFARLHLSTSAGQQRFHVALREGLHNALRHGSAYGEYVSVEISQHSSDVVEATITQQREWPTWDMALGARRKRDLLEVKQSLLQDAMADPLLGGTVLISALSDEIIGKNNGRKLTLRFSDRRTESTGEGKET